MPVRAKPNGPRVLVKPVEASEMTHHGIVLPDEVREKEQRGIVHSVGDGWYREMTDDGMTHTPLSMSPGDVVVYARRSGIPVTLDLQEDGTGEDFVVLLVQDILLVLEDVPSTHVVSQGEVDEHLRRRDDPRS